MSLERGSGGDWGLVSGTIKRINDSESCLCKVEQETGTHQLPDSLSRSEAWATGCIPSPPPLSSLPHPSRFCFCFFWLHPVLVAVYRLNCPAACEILVPAQGSNLHPLHWKVDSQPLDHQWSPNLSLLMISFVICSGKCQTFPLWC